ncbi:MAG: hypothetical protein [Bacteriophage sp.]|nr:MAG: hypothetical protein [Bacteriophage sp.]
MAQATIIRGGNVRVLIGNDADPVVYSNYCGFTSKSIALNKGTSDERIPDCADPEKVNWLGRNATSLSMDIDGEGVLTEESAENWVEAFESKSSVKAQVQMIFPKKTMIWEGRMLIDGFKNNAQDGEIVKASISMKSDGEMVRSTVTNDNRPVANDNKKTSS